MAQTKIVLFGKEEKEKYIGNATEVFGVINKLYFINLLKTRALLEII